jgi:hypothetical protein
MNLSHQPHQQFSHQKVLAIVGLLWLNATTYGQADENNTAKPNKSVKPISTTLHLQIPSLDTGGSISSFHGGSPPSLPRDWDSSNHVLKGSVAHYHTVDLKRNQRTVIKLQKADDDTVYGEANRALKSENYDLAAKLYEMLAERKPTDPRYFYGAGIAYHMQGNDYDAFSNLVIAWHLGDLPVYEQTAQSLIPYLKNEVDDQFRLTFRYQAHDPATIVNAGARCWKAGLTKQSIQLFGYALKNEPLYAQIAAYNLGVNAEHSRNFKLALQYYEWAAAQSHKLEATAKQFPLYKGEIEKSLKQLPTFYIEQARSDVEHTLKGNARVFVWRGWAQATGLPQHYSSEVCPLCAISRTRKEYESGQMEFRP